VEVIDRLLSMCGRAKDGTPVIREQGQPGGDVRCMVLSHLGRDVKLGTEESTCQLSDQLLAGIAFVTPAPAAKTAVQPGRVPRPVGRFVR
jgi:hypothetical protein